MGSTTPVAQRLQAPAAAGTARGASVRGFLLPRFSFKRVASPARLAPAVWIDMFPVTSAVRMMLALSFTLLDPFLGTAHIAVIAVARSLAEPATCWPPHSTA